MYRVQYFRDRKREWRWTLFASNGKKVATCGEGYQRARDCVKMARKLFPWLVVLCLLSVKASAQDHADVVASVKASLVARGVDLAGPCGAAQITVRVAWALRAEGLGLVGKNSGQNGCDFPAGRFAVDAVMYPDGRTFDILGLAESNNGDTSDPAAFNLPGWSVTGSAPVTSWRAPFDPGDVPAPVVSPPVVVPPAPPSSSGDLSAVVDLIGDMQADIGKRLDAQAAQLTHIVAVLETAKPPDAPLPTIDTNESGWFMKWIVERVAPVAGAAITAYLAKGTK